VGNLYVPNLEGCDLSTLTTQAPGSLPTPDRLREDKKDSPELLLDVANAKHERSFPVNDVPPMSATSRSHLMDLQSLPFSIPGSSTSSTLRLYS
jgi:hypothetical protein